MNIRIIAFNFLVFSIAYSKLSKLVPCTDVVREFEDWETRWRCLNNGKIYLEKSRAIFYLLQDKNGRQSICKIMKTRDDDPQDRAQTEFRTLHRFSSPNIIGLYGRKIVDYGKRGKVSMILEEFATTENLLDFARDNPDLFADPRYTMKMVAGIVQGVKSMHKKGLVHTDIRPENVVVDANQVPKLIDFELVSQLNGPAHYKGSLAYSDPRLVTQGLEILDEKVDVYSLGVLMYELLTDKLPIPVSLLTNVQRVFVRQNINFPENTEFRMAMLIYECLQVDPQNRPDMDVIIRRINEYLRSPNDLLIQKASPGNSDGLSKIPFKIIKTVDRSDIARQYIQSQSQRILLGKNDENFEKKFAYFLPVVSAVSAILMFLIFRVLKFMVEKSTEKGKTGFACKPQNSEFVQRNQESVQTEFVGN